MKYNSVCLEKLAWYTLKGSTPDRISPTRPSPDLKIIAPGRTVARSNAYRAEPSPTKIQYRYILTGADQHGCAVRSGLV